MNPDIIKKSESSPAPDPVMFIKALEQQVLQEGNVDSEITQFEQIISELSAHTINPDDAIAKAQLIVDKRQNYH